MPLRCRVGRVRLEEHKVIVVEEERTLLEDVPVEEVADDEDRDPEVRRSLSSQI